MTTGQLYGSRGSFAVLAVGPSCFPCDSLFSFQTATKLHLFDFFFSFLHVGLLAGENNFLSGIIPFCWVCVCFAAFSTFVCDKFADSPFLVYLIKRQFFVDGGYQL